MKDEQHHDEQEVQISERARYILDGATGEAFDVAREVEALRKIAEDPGKPIEESMIIIKKTEYTGTILNNPP